MQEFSQREQEMGEWLGGTILYFFASAIQLACVNCPVFEVKKI